MVVVVCDLARANLKSVPRELISRATERLRDKKVPLRPVWDILGPSQAHFGGGNILCRAYEELKWTRGGPKKDELGRSCPI